MMKDISNIIFRLLIIPLMGIICARPKPLSSRQPVLISHVLVHQETSFSAVRRHKSTTKNTIGLLLLVMGYTVRDGRTSNESEKKTRPNSARSAKQEQKLDEMTMEQIQKADIGMNLHFLLV